MQSKVDRINWIDWGKTLGIFLVIIGHMYYPEERVFIRSAIYGFHMPFFFLISGILHKKEPFSICFKKNIQRLVIPYFLFNTIIFFIVKVFLEDLDRSNLLIFMKNIILGYEDLPSIPTWFLLALFWGKIISNLILKLKSIHSICVSILIGFIGYFIYNYIYELPFFICQGLLATPILIISYYLMKYNILELLREKRKFMAVTFILFFPIYIVLVNKLNVLVFVYCNLTEKPIEGIFMALIGCYLFLIFCLNLNKYSNLFTKIMSTGTILILAVHQDIYIYLLKYLDLSRPSLRLSFFLCSFIMILAYPTIIFLMKWFPMLIGYSKRQRIKS